jgi:hypothetical protein
MAPDLHEQPFVCATETKAVELHAPATAAVAQDAVLAAHGTPQGARLTAGGHATAAGTGHDLC